MTTQFKLPLVPVLAVLFLLQGCLNVRPWRSQERPWTQETVAAASQVRATRTNGTTVLLKDAQLDAEAGVLSGTLVDSKPALETMLPLDQVALLETRRIEGGRVLADVALGAGYAALMVIAGIFLFVAALG